MEHRPVAYVPADAADRAETEALGPLLRRAPRDQDELIQYVEWAAPRARKLGTRVTKPELRAIGFVHGLHRENKARLEREAAEMARAAAELARATVVLALAFVLAVVSAVAAA